MIEKSIGLIALICSLFVSCTGTRLYFEGYRPCEEVAAELQRDSVKADILADSISTLIRRNLLTEADLALRNNFKPIPESQYYKLKARIFEKSNDWLNASAYWSKAADIEPDSTRLTIKHWSAMLKAGEIDTMIQEVSRKTVRDEWAALSGKQTFRDLYLAHIGGSMLGDSTAVDIGDRFIELYPTSEEATDLIGGRFWDGLYPIWTNDSAKIPYLKDFIAKYRENSWANYGYRNLIVTYLTLNDTVAAIQAACDWIARAPNHPNMLSGAGSYLLDLPQGRDSAIVWIERAYAHLGEVVRPPHVTPEEWLLYEQTTKATIPLQMADLRMRDGNLPAARQFAEESLKLADYDLDDNNTSAPQHFMLGRIALAEGDTTEAAEWWVECAREGDVYNRFAGRAVDSLKAYFGLSGEKELLAFCRDVTRYKGITFDRVTKEVGLDSARGSRVAWGDYLLAGGSSLYSVGSLKTNDQKYFYNMTSFLNGESNGSHGGIWGDYDSDGDLDLFCFSSASSVTGSEKLLRYSSQDEEIRLQPKHPFDFFDCSVAPLPKFYNETSNSPALPDSFSTEAAIWFDANGDGRLDLYIPGYERPAKGANDLGNAWPSRLMVQDDKGVFHDSTAAFGLTPKDGKWFCARSPVSCDFDRDGDQDLYVGNYRLQRNQFFVNNSMEQQITQIEQISDPKPKAQSLKTRFFDLAAYYGIDGDEVEGWWGHTIGCQWADFDTDGDFDLIACNLAHPRYIGFSNRTMLYRNDREDSQQIKQTEQNAIPNSKFQIPNFKDVRREWGIKYEECHSEPVFGDFDNDGDLDLFITCVYPNRRSFLYENKGDHFEDITFLSGVRIFNGWGCATADYDNDGKLDLTACEGGKIELFHNTTQNSNNWIEIAPDRSPGVHLSQIGGIVEIEANGQKFIRQFEGGKGAGSQNSGTLHFGLGKAAGCKASLFNKGESFTFNIPTINQKFVIDEAKLTNGND